MDGRAFLDVARELAAGSSEPHWRSSVGRSYYALLHEVLGTLQRWGFSPPARDKVHTFARLKLVYATVPDLKRIGLTLEALGRLRNAADCSTVAAGPVRIREECRLCSGRCRCSRRADRRPRCRPRAACVGRGNHTPMSTSRPGAGREGVGPAPPVRDGRHPVRSRTIPRPPGRSHPVGRVGRRLQDSRTAAIAGLDCSRAAGAR